MSNVEKNKGKAVEVKHLYQHNVYIKQMTYRDAGTTYHGHHHDYDHVTLIVSGRVRVKFKSIPEMNIPDEVREYTGVDMFVTRSFREHEITSLEPNTVVCCVHALRNEDGDIIELDYNEENKHDPDLKFQSWADAKQALGNEKRKRIAFTATPKELNNMYKRAEKEGVLVEGSQDILV